MKNLSIKMLLILSIVFLNSCSKTESSSNTNLGGDPSPMAKVGESMWSNTALAGVSNWTATVNTYDDGISTYNVSATVTNTVLKNLAANYSGVVISGNKVTIPEFKIQQTKEGVKSLYPGREGIVVKYSSNVGDTYPIGNTGESRRVVSKSTTDDYPYGFYMIKTIQVESDAMLFGGNAGIKSIRYIANHKFGIVGLKATFSDGTSATYTVSSSKTND